MPEILKEFHGSGHINLVANKYAGWFFMVIVVSALGYAYKHENSLELYIRTHVTQHTDEHEHIDGKLDDIMDQMNDNFIANDNLRKIDKEEYKLIDVSERLAYVKRIIERGDQELPGIYFEDRDRYVLEISVIEMAITNLKGQM